MLISENSRVEHHFVVISSNTYSTVQTSAFSFRFCSGNWLSKSLKSKTEAIQWCTVELVDSGRGCLEVQQSRAVTETLVIKLELWWLVRVLHRTHTQTDTDTMTNIKGDEINWGFPLFYWQKKQGLFQNPHEKFSRTFSKPVNV